MGIDREWPELFDAICVLASEDSEAIQTAREEAERNHKREQLVAQAKARYG